jgi:hypothetical protein
MSAKTKLSGSKKKKFVGKVSIKQKTMRDVLSTPSLAQIQKSIQQGVTRSAADFRTMAGW